jgi:hypothetical protein
MWGKIQNVHSQRLPVISLTSRGLRLAAQGLEPRSNLGWSAGASIMKPTTLYQLIG